MPANPTLDNARGDPAVRWLPGEYAECTHFGPWFRRGITPNRNGPSQGAVLKVRNVIIANSPWTGRPTLMLAFDREGTAFPAKCFRKVKRPSLRAKAKDRVNAVRCRLMEVDNASIVTAIGVGFAAVMSRVMDDNQ